MGNTFNTGRLINGLFTDANGNVGINTTSPSYKLDVNGAGRFTGALRVETSTSPGFNLVKDASVDNRYIRLTNTQASSKNWDIINQTNSLGNNFQVYNTTDNVNGLSISPAGNIAFGASHSSWDSTIKPIEIGTNGSFFGGYNSNGSASVVYVGANVYYNGGWKYANTSSYKPQLLDAGGGNWHFQNAATGTAGNSITWVTLMKISDNGNIGIGTTTGTSYFKLNTDGHAVFLPNSYSTDGANDPYRAGIGWQSFANPGVVLSTLFTTINDGNYGGHFVWLSRGTNGGNLSEKMRINSSGNVGIGTSSPGSTLSINGTTGSNLPVVDITASGTGTYMRGVRMLNSGMNSGNHIMYALGKSDNARNMGQFYFYYAGDGSTSNSVRLGLHSVDDVLNITGSGYVGIGTTNPTKILEIYTNDGSTSTTSGLKITNFSTTTDARAGIVFQNYDNNGAAIWSNRTGSTAGELVFGINPANGIAETNIVEKVRISRYGELLVNTTVATSSDPVHRIGLNGGSTLARLMIQERTGVWISWNTGSTNYGTVYLNGSVVVYGGQSDYRLKENIVEMESGLDKVMKLRPVTFNWKRDGSYGEGFIAHELQEIVPLAVTGVKDGLNELGEPDWQNVDKSHIVPVLVKAIQELKAEIEILKNK